MCTWPHDDRPDPFIVYADEVWTGIEYADRRSDDLRRHDRRARKIVTHGPQSLRRAAARRLEFRSRRKSLQRTGMWQILRRAP